MAFINEAHFFKNKNLLNIKMYINLCFLNLYYDSYLNKNHNHVSGNDNYNCYSNDNGNDNYNNDAELEINLQLD